MPLAPSLDHVGPLARSVRDLAVVLQTIAGPDPLDPACAERAVPDWVTPLHGPQRPPRLGRVRGLFESRADAAVRGMMEEVTARLRERGAGVQEVALPASFAEVLERHRTVMAVEAAAYHEARLRRNPEDYGPCIRGLLEEGLACPAPEYARTKEHQAQLGREVLACLADVDALLTPATTTAAPDAGSTGDPAFNSPWSYTGLPTVSLPAVWTGEGLPLAIQLVGAPWGEGTLFAAGAWCEDALGFEAREAS
jgi:aspartyl-tRNA(Asn)/glutamyl-tRNA(Gln) amidotransferase subunit A